MGLSDCMYAWMHRQHVHHSFLTTASWWLSAVSHRQHVTWVSMTVWGRLCPHSSTLGTTSQLTPLKVELFEGFVQHKACLTKTKMQCGREGGGRREVKLRGGKVWKREWEEERRRQVWKERRREGRDGVGVTRKEEKGSDIVKCRAQLQIGKTNSKIVIDNVWEIVWAIVMLQPSHHSFRH